MNYRPRAATLGIALLMVIGVACSSDAKPPEPIQDGVAGGGLVSVSAPIESVEIEKVEANPPNSMLIVVSGGLNGCVSFEDYHLEVDSETFRVQVTNLMQPSPMVPCAPIYTTVTNRIPLPSDVIEACKSYAVEVNGEESRSVQASCPAIESGLSQETTPTP